VRPETEQDSRLRQRLLRFKRSYWRVIVVGFVLGSIVGFISPTVGQIAYKLGGDAFSSIYKFSEGISVWPKHGVATLITILFVALAFYVIRLNKFRKRFWSSWRAGLVSGIGVIWFLISAITFALFSLTDSLLPLSLLGFGLAGMVAIYKRDVRIFNAAKLLPDGDLDSPIQTSDEDIVGRRSVVDAIVRAIVSDRVPVVALAGDFGDGKSSVLNLLSSSLGGQSNVVVVRFSTWLPMDAETLVSTLLSSVLEKIETRLFVPKIKRNFVAFTHTLFAVLPGIPASVRDLFSEPSQSGQIADLRRNLSKLPVRVAILLDDLDRMHRNELDVLFKLLRGVPEFPQFTYVCAFHPHALVQILQSGPNVRSERDAQHFLEKFFPEQMPLPKIDSAILADEFSKRFFSICDRQNLVRDSDERQKFEADLQTLWQSCLKRYFINLRRVKLFANQLSRSLPVVAQEVNVRDFLLLEIVRMINPVIYEDIFRNAGYFIFARWRSTAWLDVVDVDENREADRRRFYFDKLFEGISREPEDVLLCVLKELFPAVKFYLSGDPKPSGGSPAAVDAGRQRRIYDPDFFARYFTFSVPQAFFGEKDLSEFVSRMNSNPSLRGSVDAFKSAYLGLEGAPMKRLDFLHRVESSAERFGGNAIHALPLALGELSQSFDNDTSKSFDEIAGRGILFAAADRLDTDSDVQSFLADVISFAASDRFAAELLNDCASGRRAPIVFRRTVDVAALTRAFRKRMNEKYGTGKASSIFPLKNSSSLFPIGRWGACGPEGRAQVQGFLMGEFAASHSRIGNFLVQFFPSDKTLAEDDPRTQDPIGTIRRFYFDPDEMIKLLTEYGESAYSSQEEAQAVSEFKGEYARQGSPSDA
jgi:KAP family P-loop domain